MAISSSSSRRRVAGMTALAFLPTVTAGGIRRRIQPIRRLTGNGYVGVIILRADAATTWAVSAFASRAAACNWGDVGRS